MSNIYTFDGQNEIDKSILDLMIQNNIALIGKGKSQNKYVFNLSTTVCLWVNPISKGWREMVKRLYGEFNTERHIACISGYHPELIEKFRKENPDVNVFTFQEKNSKWNIPGAYPAFLHYLTKVILKTGKKLYIVGNDMDEPGRSFQSEIDGMRNIYRHYKNEGTEGQELLNRILQVQKYRDIMFQVMSYNDLIKDENIICFPETGGDKTGV